MEARYLAGVRLCWALKDVTDQQTLTQTLQTYLGVNLDEMVSMRGKLDRGVISFITNSWILPLFSFR